MKLKMKPEDFKVEEINSFEIKKSGNFCLYILEKRGIESFELISYLSKTFNIPQTLIGIAGLKDRHAVTKQYMTIPSNYKINGFSETDFNLSFIGFIDNPIKLSDSKGNKFEITVRDLKKGELDGITQKANTISEIGVPNYFDSQRFGSVQDGIFIAKYLIKQDYENAVKFLLTSTTKSDNLATKREKNLILSNWDNLSAIRVENTLSKKIIQTYLQTNDWLLSYKSIPSNLKRIYVSAYQSHLWNTCIKFLLRDKINTKNLYSIKYAAGTLLFYRKISESELTSLPESFKSISDEIKPSNLEANIIKRVLSREGISLESFNIKKATDNFFKTHDRAVLVKPSDFKISAPTIDELNDRGNNNTFKIVLSFSLPTGSYATIITKRIFNQ